MDKNISFTGYINPGRKFVFLIFIFSFPFLAGLLRGQEIDTAEYKTPTIEVDALRGMEKVISITYDNIKREAIEKKSWMQDLPMFLSGNTNINSYSESGSSIGYTYFTVRGFDQRRISVLVNGTTQNDAEDHQVYWVELSDIISSVESIQIQRGVGTALYGTSGIGGVINVRTLDFFKYRFVNLNAGYGSYNSQRYSLEYSSGLTGNGFGFYGKFSKTKTDGYRNLSWSDHWSYFLSAGKMLGERSVLKLNFYGSPIKNHMAYNGITKDYLDGRVTGDRRNDRRYNPLEQQNETDNYYKPHYEFVYNIQAAKDLFITNTLNYIRGDGYVTTNYPLSKGYDYTYYHLQPFFCKDTFTFNSKYYLHGYKNRIDSFPGLGYKIVRSDMIVNLHTNSSNYGWYPKVQWKHSGEEGSLLVGGEYRLYNSEHFGEISFGNTLPPGTPVNYRFYFHNGKKKTVSLYANEFSTFSKKLACMIGVQYTFHKYTVENDLYKPYNFDVSFKFLTSRIAFNYSFFDNFRAFAGLSIARREPRLKDFYDANNPYARPNFVVVDTVNQIYSEALVQYEELTDYEIGLGYTSNLLKASLNFYVMDYTNEIVGNGQLDNIGQPVYSNAGKSIHKGIEFEFEYNILANIRDRIKHKNPALTLVGNLSLSDNYFIKYIEKLGVDTLGNILYGNDNSGNKILLNPQIIGNLSLNFGSYFGLAAFLAVQYIGKQYLDNTENEKKNPSARLVAGYVDKIINPYTVLNAGVSLDIISLVKSKGLNRYFRSLEVSLKINNILVRLYETSGGLNSGWEPVWIPAAERNIFFNLRIGF